METEWVPILDIIKKGSFEASVITTYNAYLPFYEDVVLRKLISSGCRHNVLIMDAGQLSESLSTPVSRPQLAGRAYTIIPVATSSSFHPKVALLVAKKKGLLLVGSNNMTLSGWGMNKELTNCITFTDTDTEGVQMASQTWRFVMRWVAEYSSNLPASLLDALQAVRNFAPWLITAHASVATSPVFYGSAPAGQSLWANVSENLTAPIERVTVLGPFFGNRLDFLQTLKRDLQPREIIVGIDPDSVEMPEIEYRKTDFRFVDASRLIETSGYLHAKAIYVEGVSGENWLITGSANPSRPAWTAPEHHRNAEAVVLHIGESAGDIADRLQIAGLKEFPTITDEAWSKMRERLRKERGERRQEEKVRILIGVAINGGVHFFNTAFSEKEFLKAVCLDEGRGSACEFTHCESSGGNLFIPISEGLESLRIIEIHLKGGETFLGLVHHDSEIKQRAMNSRQAQFRKNMAALQDGTPDLENLIVTIGKIIFEEPFEIDPSAKRSQTQLKGKSKDTEAEKEITSLATNISETKKEKRRRRIVTSGDIGYLIDYLIRRLGDDLKSEETESPEVDGPFEEEKVGADDEEPEREPESIDTLQLIKICNGKVKKLVSRMIQTFEQAAEQEEGCEKCLVKFLGVLALLRELRSLDYKLDGVPPWETFVPFGERERLLKNALIYLYGNEHRFLKKINVDDHIGGWEELSKLHGLLLWLAHDCGADLFASREFSESPEKTKTRRGNKARMLLVTPDAASDESSLNEAIASINKTTPRFKKPKSKVWIENHRAFGQKLYQLRQKADTIQKKITKPPKRGQIAFLRGDEILNFYLVLQTGTTVELLDVSNEHGKKICSVKNVASFNFPTIA